MPAPPLLAVFVGGKSRRMGRPKGLLEVPGTGVPIVESLVSLGVEAGFRVVLVGDAEPYAALAKSAPRIDDDPPGAGPLAGLRAALRYAVQNGSNQIVSVACDMPFVTAAALEELANHPSSAPVIAARRTPQSPWEPMLARYDVAALIAVLDAALGRGCRSFQQLFKGLEIEPLHLSPAVDRALADWDTPEDLGT